MVLEVNYRFDSQDRREVVEVLENYQEHIASAFHPNDFLAYMEWEDKFDSWNHKEMVVEHN